MARKRKANAPWKAGRRKAFRPLMWVGWLLVLPGWIACRDQGWFFFPSADREAAKQRALASKKEGCPGSDAKRAPYKIPDGILEYPERLSRFFEQLARLEQGQTSRPVRIMQWGDSHTVADIETGSFRRILQARFGDGGRGWIALGKPWKTYNQEGIENGMTRGWTAQGSTSAEQDPLRGYHGLYGVSVSTHKRAEEAWTDIKIPSSQIEIAFLKHPQGGTFDVLIDGIRHARISSRQKRPGPAYRAFELAEGFHRLEIHTQGQGEVRLWGAVVERHEPGIVVDALGFNGARVTAPLKWDERHRAEQLKHRRPDLMILAYGTNEADDQVPWVFYEQRWIELLTHIRKALPNTACLVLGPPDRAVQTPEGWTTPSRLSAIVASERQVAFNTGCAFFSQFDAMGGTHSMARWLQEDPPRAQKDGVHCTRKGYTQLGAAFANALLQAYAQWREEQEASNPRAERQ